MSYKYKEYQIKKNKVTKPHLDNLTRSFINNLKRNIKSTERFNFKTSINIKEENKNKFIMIDFNNKSIKEQDRVNENSNLKIKIESNKIRNLLLSKYPMNFMTFHNGGYTCERKVMSLTSNEKKYWSWINNLDFFI